MINPPSLLKPPDGFFRHYGKWIGLLVLGITALVLLIPMPAFAANPLLDPAGWLKEDVLQPAIENMLNAFVDYIKNMSTDNLLTGGFTSLFGTDGAADSLWNIISAVHQTLLVPLGESILALVMLVQLVKISQRIDANATMPALKEVVFLAVFYIIFHWLIVNSLDLCSAVYGEINRITLALTNDAQIDSTVSLGDVTNADLGVMILALITSFFIMLAGMLVAVISYVMAGARAIQLYVMSVFSPIPFSLMGFEETRSFGINFCKNFIAVCLAGTIMMFVIIAFPSLYVAVVGSATLIDAGGTLLFNAVVKLIGLPILCLIAIVKSGAWARDILGG